MSLHRALPHRLIYPFDGESEGTASRDLLGGKGAALQTMTHLGLPVPPGFTLTTELCGVYHQDPARGWSSLQSELRHALAHLEAQTGKRFGGAGGVPLLVSVRSGASISMPGMMDTILNLGLNDATVEALSAASGNPRFAYDSYRRFVAMYGEVVLEIPAYEFAQPLDQIKTHRGFTEDAELTTDDLRQLVRQYRQLILTGGSDFPTDPWLQLQGAIGAVFRSWNGARAVAYRNLQHLGHAGGTAVTIQSMVFGNLGADSATGVAFTRDPSSGERLFFGEFLVNAQGEDVVAGIRTPHPLNEASRRVQTQNLDTFEKLFPQAYAQLHRLQAQLELYYRDMQDLEFTVEAGRLYLLQTRRAKRSAEAAVRVAVEMVREGLLQVDEAIERISSETLEQLLHPTLDPKVPREILARGLPAAPGAASGQIVFDSATAETWVRDHQRPVILLRAETSPEDIVGMASAQGILTSCGGMTSHAAVVARGMGKTCITGCQELVFDLSGGRRRCRLGERWLEEGEVVTLDDSSGEVLAGSIACIMPTPGAPLRELMQWVDSVRTLEVRANADTPTDADTARSLGAQGIGLCRSEHMFFDPERIGIFRELILSSSPKIRARALDRIRPFQVGDFIALFASMEGLPVSIRLLDPPLHEFIPEDVSGLRALAAQMGVSEEDLRRQVGALHEQNPMLGHRGCRLGVSYPEIYRAQVRAIFEAARHLHQTRNLCVRAEIMIPFIGESRELAYIRLQCTEELRACAQEFPDFEFRPQFGVMIELPRAALTANHIAQHAKFMSFGTNDLTQMTYGLSRDDSARFLPDYLHAGIYDYDPFTRIDPLGVGALMQIAIERARSVRPTLKFGICGEHGGEPHSIQFCHDIGLDYVSCSPYRTPMARLAAAHAEIRNPRRTRAEKTSRTVVAPCSENHSPRIALFAPPGA